MFNKEIIYFYEDLLMKSVWDSNSRSYEQIDLTGRFKKHLLSEVVFHNNVKLKHIISFIEKDLPFWKQVLTSHLVEIIEESKTEFVKKTPETEVEFLEVYYILENDSEHKETHGLLLPGFHGVGFLKEDDEHSSLKKGERINYSVELTPSYELMDLPLRIKSETLLLTNLKNSKYKEQNLGYAPFSLLGIISAIFQELSFHGSVSQRTNFANDLKKTIDDIKQNVDDDDKIKDTSSEGG